ncbi:MAG: URC4/urg3 family protein [Leptolyngbyaceae bacterium]|nr:URC4/urg3 family protein [Leptolyngbyaceae bacterium]
MSAASSSPNTSIPDVIQADVIQYLRSPLAIRERCSQLFNLALVGDLEHFSCHLDQLDETAQYVIQVTQHAYPDAKIPFHSRWRHFEVGTASRMAAFQNAIQPYSPPEQARIKIDLAVVSVLLDAGAGKDWSYREPDTDGVWSRSEGLAIASFHMFCNGAFSSDPDHPLRVDAEKLRSLTLDDLAAGFQVSRDNPLVGLDGRLHLLHHLGDALLQSPQIFQPGEIREPDQPSVARPGYLLDYLVAHHPTHTLPAEAVLSAVLEGFSSIWPGRVILEGVNLGDVWPHPALPKTSPGSHLVPFHKLSQWLTYSLLEPLAEGGLTINDLDSLTGLPEYRNGGLFIDFGVLQPKHEAVTQQTHSPESSVIVEWRSLTVILLDRLAERIRQKLTLTAEQLPLACVLQGGSWSAGRKIAAERRPGGVPPIQISSDGTVF